MTFAAILDIILNNQAVQAGLAAVGGALALFLAKRRGVKQGRAEIRAANERTRREHQGQAAEIDRAVAGDSDEKVGEELEEWSR